LAGYAAFCMVLNALPLHIPLFLSMLLWWNYLCVYLDWTECRRHCNKIKWNM